MFSKKVLMYLDCAVHLDSLGWPSQIANESSQEDFCCQCLLARKPAAHFTRQHVLNLLGSRVGVKIVRISERNLELIPIFNVICC